MNTSNITSRVTGLINAWKALPMNGEPSVTRWVFLRTFEVIALGWLALVGVVIYRYAKSGTADAAICALIGTVAAGMAGFASNNMNIKTTTEAQLASDKTSATTTTVLSSTTEVQ